MQRRKYLEGQSAKARVKETGVAFIATCEACLHQEKRVESKEEEERPSEGASRNGKQQAVGTHRGVLQEEGRVEEAPDAFESAPARHSWPRHRSRGLRRLLGRRAVLQSRHRSSFFFLLFFLLSLNQWISFCTCRSVILCFRFQLIRAPIESSKHL